MASEAAAPMRCVIELSGSFVRILCVLRLTIALPIQESQWFVYNQETHTHESVGSAILSFTIKRYLIVFLVMLAVGVGMVAKPVSASIEDDIMRFLRGLGSQMDVIQRYQGEGTTANMGRFDSIDSKLDRIYESCGRATTAARRVTSA